MSPHDPQGINGVSLERLDINADGDLLYTFTRPWSDGTTGIKLSPLELLEKLAALVPLPRLQQVRYGGGLAPHSKLRATIIPTPRQQGVEKPVGSTASLNWAWARLLKRVFAIDLERCPVCQQGMLRIIAAITEVSVIQKILRYVKLAVAPRPLRPRSMRRLHGAPDARSGFLRSDMRPLLCFSRMHIPPFPERSTSSSLWRCR